jgi:hypothetical protein
MQPGGANDPATPPRSRRTAAAQVQLVTN